MMKASRGADSTVDELSRRNATSARTSGAISAKEVDTVKTLAIMTDSDDSGQRATAWYGDISFATE